MLLQQKQVMTRVAVAMMIIGTTTAWACTAPLPAWFPLPAGSEPIDMLTYAISTSMPMFLVVLLMIIIVGMDRFSSPTDIDAAASAATPSLHVRIHQAVLQNTLEQAVLAFGLHLAWAVIMPVERAVILPLTSLQFLVGRVLFLVGYKHGAAGRALGFSLTFSPSLMMAVWMAARLLGWVS